MKFENQPALVDRFFKSFDGKEVTIRQFQLIDLYRAIHCYRMYRSVDDFFTINPELEAGREDITDLWAEFGKTSNEELAELALDILMDINKI